MLTLVMTFGALGTIVFERICATIWLNNYEKTVSNLMFGFCLFCQIPVACGFAYLMYIKLVSTFLCGILTSVAVCSGYSILIFLEWFNKRRYKASLSDLTTYTLSERFQLQENIRTALLLRRIVKILSGGFLFIGGCTIALYYYSDNFIEKCVMIMLNCLMCFCSYTFPLFGVASNTVTFQTIQKLKSMLPRSRVSSSEIIPYTDQQRQTSLSTQIRGFDGSQIIFTIDEEREVYFKQLKAGWN
uniref:Uncharacterized protein n=1 Tax=Panagrolaimus superbus TaxID=310955 RepID=A0A914YTB5_9BILA